MFDLNIALWVSRIPALVIALAFHEYAHARMAVWLGDNTPRYQGRLTINPLAHLDIVGTLLILVTGFGWAKPVAIYTGGFKDPKQDAIIVALSGPIMNLIVAFLVYGIVSFIPPGTMPDALFMVVQQIFWINVMLGLFNLIPLPPLDGSYIWVTWLSPELRYQIGRLGLVWIIILLVLIQTSFMSHILEVPMMGFLHITSHFWSLF